MAAGNLFGSDLDLTRCSQDSFDARPPGKPRLVHADRMQLRLESRNLDALVADDHRVRALWDAAQKLDLSAFHDKIRAREAHAGRPAIDPCILVTLWLYATSEGIGSARQLSRLCRQHDVYRWICGGIEVCHRVLSDFRIGHEKALDGLLTELIAVLMHAGVVTLTRVAQDGTKVRASAGAASFRREHSLKQCLTDAAQQVKDLRKQLDAEDETTDTRRVRAKQRAVEQRQQRVAQALEALEQIRDSRARNGKKAEPRASTTDADARVMKMADGGFRPAYNMQIAVDVASRIIVGARATNSGGDMGQVEPTLEEIEARTGKRPADYLIDGGFAKLATIETLTDGGVCVFAPVMQSSKERDLAKRQREDSDAVAAWRQRMATDEAKETYRERAATIETTNADLKAHRGLERLRVRGIGKVTCALLWSVLTHNLMRAFALAPSVFT